MVTSTLQKAVLRQQERERARRELQDIAGRALSASKRSIFSWQRGDRREAESLLREARASFDHIKPLVKQHPALAQEGVWRAAQEEYCEAQFVHEFFSTGTVGKLTLITQDSEILIGGLSDFIGELARCAVLRATDGDGASVDRFYDAAKEVVALLLQLDLTGSLRSKFDQAKQHLRKLEDIRYDLSRRV